MTIRIKDVNNVDKYRKIIKEINKTTLEIGIFSSDGADIMMIAFVNEFGWDIKVTDKMRGYLGATGIHLKRTTTHIKIPERSYIRGGFDAHAGQIRKFAQRQLRLALNMDITPEQMFVALGEYCTGKIRTYLTRLKEPPNHPYTIANKKRSNPLVNTGALRQRITWRTRKVI